VSRFALAVTRMLTMGALMALAASVAAQQAYPNKPIRMIVPFPPGGTNTIVARIVGQKLTENWGQPVVVDNRPGGNTIIGTDALAKSAPDGYTLILVSSAHILNSVLLPNLPYDSIKDFAPVTLTTVGQYTLVVHPSLPANNLRELIALAKAKPGQLNYSTSGTGGVQHLAGELFNIMAGVKTQHIPYKGAGPALTDLLGGQVQFSFQPPSNVLAHIKSGRLRIIAIPNDARLAVLPDAPTFAEAGMPGFEVKSWTGVLAPANAPKAIIDKLSAEIGTILALPDIRQKMLDQGIDPYSCTPEQFGALMKAEVARVANTVKIANIKLED